VIFFPRKLLFFFAVVLLFFSLLLFFLLSIPQKFPTLPLFPVFAHLPFRLFGLPGNDTIFLLCSNPFFPVGAALRPPRVLLLSTSLFPFPLGIFFYLFVLTLSFFFFAPVGPSFLVLPSSGALRAFFWIFRRSLSRSSRLSSLCVLVKFVLVYFLFFQRFCRFVGCPLFSFFVSVSAIRWSATGVTYRFFLFISFFFFFPFCAPKRVQRPRWGFGFFSH